jgi:hypothetical protein
MSQLFDTFEINRVPRWPLMSRLVALSVVLHGLFLVAVVYVPTLRGLLYVASTVSGFEFVSEDYDRTLVGQRATIVQLGPHEKLYYPPDYFGSPEVAETTQFDPMVIQQSTPPPPPPLYRPRRVRTPRVVATPEPSPSPELAEAAPSPSPADGAAPDEAQKKADAELDKIAQENGVKRPPVINTQPFEDIAVKGKTMIEEGKIDLKTSTLDVTVSAERNEDGTLKDGYRIEGLAGDETMSALASDIVAALSASKVLAIIDGAKAVNLGLKLDQQNVTIRITGEMASDTEATRMATGYGLLLAIAGKRKQGTREGELYKSLKVDNDGRQFVMTFEMPKEAAGKVISDLLAEKAAKAAAARNKS